MASCPGNRGVQAISDKSASLWETTLAISVCVVRMRARHKHGCRQCIACLRRLGNSSYIYFCCLANPPGIISQTLANYERSRLPLPFPKIHPHQQIKRENKKMNKQISRERWVCAEQIMSHRIHVFQISPGCVEQKNLCCLVKRLVVSAGCCVAWSTECHTIPFTFTHTYTRVHMSTQEKMAVTAS